MKKANIKATQDDGLEWLRDIRREMAAESKNDPKLMGQKLRELEKNTPAACSRRGRQSRSPSKSNHQPMSLNGQPIYAEETSASSLFDAVAESRKWKEAVARETKGMTIEEHMACFRRHSPIIGIRGVRSSAIQRE